MKHGKGKKMHVYMAVLEHQQNHSLGVKLSILTDI